jgi:hypothetical protein
MTCEHGALDAVIHLSIPCTLAAIRRASGVSLGGALAECPAIG